MPHDVFISCSTLNKADADAAVDCLEREKIACWIAHRDNAKGSAFGGSVDNAIVECKLFVVLVSRASIDSKTVENELDAAHRLNKLIIPVFIEDIEPSGFMRDYIASRESFNLTDKQPELLAQIRRQLNPTGPSAAEPAPLTDDAAPTRAPADSIPRSPRLVSPVFRPDDSVGRYRILRLIGRGGMGMVYEAMQVNPKRRVALKVMDPTLASSGAIRRFRTEADLLGRLNHEGIARIYEADTYRNPDHPDAEPVPFFAMEFIEAARPITDYAASKGLDTNARLKLIALVCDAVDHGHQAGVLHRDLKPENIVVDANGRIKVIDFGIARVTEPELAATRITEVGQLVGTLQYMSPEQFDGYSDRLSNSSDIYSLGIILYELICGRLPYDVTGKTVIQAAHVVRETTPPPPSKLDGRCRGDIETIVLKAIHKDPNRRYLRARDMAHDIQRFLSGEPIQARQDSMVYVVKKRTAKWAGRKPEAALFVIFALVIAFILVALEQAGLLRRPLGDAPLYSLLQAGPAPAPLAGPWDHVRVVEYDQKMDFEAFAKHLNVAGEVHNLAPPEDPAHPEESPVFDPSWRLVHGAVMKKLASVGAKVVAWDSAFSARTDYDPEFIEGMKALASAQPPVDVVITRKTWQPRGAGIANENLIPYVSSGAAIVHTGEVGRARVCGMDLAIRHANTTALPSFSLLAYAHAMFPGYEPELEFRGDVHYITLVLNQPEDKGGPGDRSSGITKDIGVTIIDTVGADSTEWGLRGEAALAVFYLHMPQDAVLENATLSYTELVYDTPDQLRAKLAGKVVMIGQRRDGDMVEFPDGRVIPGTYTNAATVECLIRDVRIRVLGDRGRVFAVIGFCALGLLLAIPGRKSLGRLLLFLALGGVASAIAPVIAYRASALLFNPLVPAIGMVICSLLAWQVLRLHRSQLFAYRGEPSA